MNTASESQIVLIAIFGISTNFLWVVEENTTLIHNSFPELHIFDAQSTCIWSPSLYFVIQQIQTRLFNKYKLNDSKNTNLVIQQIQTWISTNTKLIISVSPSWQRRPSVWLKICNANLDFLCPGLRRWGWWWRKMEPFWHPTENLQCFSSVAWSPNLNKEEQISQKYVQSEFVWIQVLLSWVFSGSHFEDSTEWG